LADTVIKLSHGRVELVGRPKDVLFSRGKFSLKGIVLEKITSYPVCVLSVGLAQKGFRWL